MKKLALLSMLFLFLQGCGTLLLEAHSPIKITGDESDNIKYYIYDMQNNLVASGKAPDQVEFTSSKKYQDEFYRVALVKAGEAPKLFEIERGVGTLSAIGGGFIVVDYMMDSFREFPEVSYEDKK